MSSYVSNLGFEWLVVLGLLILLAIHTAVRIFFYRSYLRQKTKPPKSDAEISKILRAANDALTNRPRHKTRK